MSRRRRTSWRTLTCGWSSNGTSRAGREGCSSFSSGSQAEMASPGYGLCSSRCHTVRRARSGGDSARPSNVRFVRAYCSAPAYSRCTLRATTTVPARAVRKIKSPFAPWAWMPQRLLPAATARWRQWEKTERGALGRDRPHAEVCTRRHGAHWRTRPRVSSWA
jgi:hypothetical protein